jgi:hypothetical protein
MRKAVMILLALLAIRLLPRTLRREARALELIAVLFQITLAAAANTAKAMSTENRVAAQERKTGKLASQAGTTSGFSNLSQTSTGSPQPGGASITVSSAVTGGATIQTGNPNGATIGGSTVAAHTHGYGHIHDYAHTHFTQVAADYNTLVAQLNTMRSALIADGLGL